MMDLPCPVTGLKDENHLHHVKGAQYRLKDSIGQSLWIGEIYIFPLYYIIHNPSHHLESARLGYCNRHYNKTEFEKKYGYDIELFIETIDLYNETYGYNDSDIDKKAIELIKWREFRG